MRQQPGRPPALEGDGGRPGRSWQVLERTDIDGRTLRPSNAVIVFRHDGTDGGGAPVYCGTRRLQPEIVARCVDKPGIACDRVREAVYRSGRRRSYEQVGFGCESSALICLVIVHG